MLAAMFRRSVIVAGALIAAGATLAGCSSSTPDGQRSGPDSSATTVAVEALEFSAPLIGGGDIDMRDYAGSAVALWFWAPT